MKNEKGFTLIDVVIAIALLGIVAVAILGGLATASKLIFIADERATAESLARTEMEYIKKCKYTDLPTSWSYELGSNPPSWDPSHALPAGYDGYSLIAQGEIFDANGDSTPDSDIQKIQITIKHHNKPIITSGDCTLEDYKVDR